MAKELTIDFGKVTFEIDDAPREMMLEQLIDMHGEEEVKNFIAQSVKQSASDVIPVSTVITDMYDVREQIDTDQLQTGE